MFEEILVAAFLFSIFTFKMTSLMALGTNFGKVSSLSQKNDERFKLFCETLKHEKASLLVDKKELDQM